MTQLGAVPQRPVADTWAKSPADLLAEVASTPHGLTEDEAQRRLAAAPRDRRPRSPSWVRPLVRQFSSPIVVILVVATVISMAVGDRTDGAIILAIVVLSGLLGFVQDFRADRDVSALLHRVQVLTAVLRDGEEHQVPVNGVVPGDLVLLRAGAVVPADCRLLAADELLVDESALTGESFPVEKDAGAVVDARSPLARRTNSVLFGTHVMSGTGRALAVRVGPDTELGHVTHDLREHRPPSSYERGTSRFGLLLVRLMLLLTVFIFVVNAALGRPILDSLLFSLALAVGLTPQMLPAIVTISLSSGAREMARHKVIVKRLDVIDDFGSMAVLCTDKTGTLTMGAPTLDGATDVGGRDSETVLELAALNAGLQDGFVNPMDQAVLARRPAPSGAVALGQVPYDFTRRMLSVVTPIDGVPTLVAKGAVRNVLHACTRALVDGREVPLETVQDTVNRQFEHLSAAGHRVLAVASRALPSVPDDLGPDTERDLVLQGLLAFHDPVRPSAPQAISRLRELGISLRLITGDNALAAGATGRQVGLAADHVLTGPEIEDLDDDALTAAAGRVEIFAEVEPAQKRRIVLALSRTGAGVGFLGDGINDAPALHAADVGISVDTAVDVAKEAASIVLLDKELDVVIDGVRVGRQTFANTLKYVRLTTSANFGNMLSMAAASLFLPFLPLLPRQILLLNFLTDIPSTAIASDAVDPEQVERPSTWDFRDIRRFLVVFGSVSTCFDLLTFAVLLWGLDAGPTEFRSGWFVESTLSELLVLFSLRTSRPMWSSRPGRLLLTLSVVVGAVIVTVPLVAALAHPLGLGAPGVDLMVAIAVIALLYVVTNEAVKRWYFRTARG